MDANESPSELQGWLEEKADFGPGDAPSWELLASAGDTFSKLLNGFGCRTADLSTDDIKSLAAAALMLSEHPGFKQMAVKGFAIALNELEELAAEFPDIAPRIIGATSAFMTAAQCVIAGNAIARHENFAARVTPIAKVNAAKAALVERAKAIATELWRADTAQEFRLSDMAEQVEDILKRDGFEELPTRERIKEWIKPAAPGYASRPGRSPKSS